MEHIEFKVPCPEDSAKTAQKWALAGVVASGNLEVLIQQSGQPGETRFVIDTAAAGFESSWRKVAEDFAERSAAGGLEIFINDNAASPATVSLRLDQTLEKLEAGR